jgi:hypothetical protein
MEAYWVLREEGGRREGLGWMERRLAYGWEVVSDVTPNGFSVKLVAFEQRPLRVERKGSAFSAKLTIAGRPAYLRRIHVKTLEGGLKPKVIYIELFGTDAASGRPAYEKIVNG